DIPSYLVKPGTVIETREKSRQTPIIEEALAAVERRGMPQWLSLEKENQKGIIQSLPAREDITMPIQEQLIVELYSK
ncbi:MAG: 30S ribosomal protein S4, partial [Desulfosudaceae bacterium]